MKRAERHHLKQDELLTSLDHAASWFATNRSVVLKSAVALLAVAVIGGGAFIYWSGQTRKADAALAKALRTYRATVGAESPPPGSTALHFQTASERYLKAGDELEKIVKEYPRTGPGRQARFYLALCQVGLERLEDAEKSLSEVMRERGDIQFYSASVSLANVKSRRGDTAAAIEMYRVLVDDPKNPLPKDMLLFQLGQWREKTGKVAEARQDYQRILDEFPSSSIRSEAESRRELLDQGEGAPS